MFLEEIPLVLYLLAIGFFLFSFLFLIDLRNPESQNKIHLFLFDVGKSKTFDEINYEVLEKIKNGRVIAYRTTFHTYAMSSPVP